MNVTMTDSEFSLLRGYLKERCGIAVPEEKRYLFATRLGEWMRTEGCPTFLDLHRRLIESGDLRLEARIVESMTTHETSFFRDEHPFTTIRTRILPALAERRAAGARYTPPRIRIWCAGCSTGEEPYSVAMVVRDWLDGQSVFEPSNVSVLATDVSRSALEKARRGQFSERQVRNGLPRRERSEYLKKARTGWLVREDLRAMVYFAEVNLSRDFRQLGFFDLILCRNVIIYFSLDLRRRILARFHEMLNPGGVLLLGASESLYQLSDRYRPVHEGPTTYYLRHAPGAEDGT